MTLRLPSPTARPSFTSRLRHWLRRAWLDRLPVAGWISAWREDRRRRQAAARRPQMRRLLPEFDPYEERSFLGPNLTMLLQVGLAGTGAALFGELLHQAFTRVDPMSSPVPPVPPAQQATADPGNDRPGVPLPAFAVAMDAEAGDPRGGGTQFTTAMDLPEEMTTHLAAPDLGGSLRNLGSGDLGDNGLASDTTPAAPGGGGGAPTAIAAAPSGGAAASGLSAADPSAAGSYTPAPITGNTAADDMAGFTGNANVSAPATAGTLLTPRTNGGAASAASSLTGLVGPVGAAPDATNVSKTYGSLPLPFEQNLGQTDPRVQFLSHGPGFAFYLTADGAATFDLTRPTQGSTAGATVTHDVLRLSLDGAAPAPLIVAQDQQPGYSNYFAGGSSPLALTNVPQYGEVVEQNVYPGINLVWHGNANRQLEYDFVVAPGANPSQIRLHIDGATSLSTDAQGDLLIQTGGGTLVQSAPVITQAATGAITTPSSVAGSAVVLPGGDLGFQVGVYNTSQPLTIDPVIQTSSYLGGSGGDQAFSIAADGSGDAYIAGITTSANFPTSTGAYQTAYGSAQALFVTKLNAQGTAYAYSTYISGVSTNVSTLYGIAVDVAGNAYVTGVTSGSSFPVTSGAYQTATPTTGLAFLTKLSATGDALLYSTYFGISSTTAVAVAVDPEGDAFLSGNTTASVTGIGGTTYFPTTASAFQTTAGSAGTTAFVTKFNATGSALLYSSFLGGAGTDKGYGIAVDNSGDAFVTGSTTSSNFPTTAGAYKTSNSSFSAVAFVTKVNPAGSALSYSSYLGGSGGDQGNAIAIDAAGAAYVAGTTTSTNFPTAASAVQTAAGGSGDAFVTKLNAAGSALVYSTYLGGSTADTGTGIAVDSTGDAVVTGTTNGGGGGGIGIGGGGGGSGFPTTSGALQSAYGGSQDAFVTRLNPGGTALSYSSYLGGSSTDTGTGVAEDAFGNAYISGYTNSSNFPTVAPVQSSSAGGLDAWVAKLSPLPAPPVFTSVTGGASTGAGQVTDHTSLTFSGTAAPGATVTLSRADLGVLPSPATADGSGNWSYSYGTTLGEGTYAFTATQTSGGVTSNPSPAYVVTVDLTGPAVTLTAPSSTNTLAPVVQVTATDLNGLPNGTTVTIQQQVSGIWSNLTTGSLTGGAATITLPAFGGAGTYPLRAQVSDLAGNVGTSATVNVTVTSAGSWSATGQVLTADPLASDAVDQLGDVQLTHALDLDQSGGTMSGGAALVYNSDSVAQQPIIQATLQSANGAAPPATVSAVLTWNGTAGATLTYSTSGLHAGDPLVIAAQVPSAVTTTGAYAWGLLLIVSGQSNMTVSGTAYVVAQDASPFGAGWTFGPVDQLFSVTGGVLMAYGTGDWRYFASAGGGSFTSPAGDNGTLSQSGGTYTYSTPDGETWTFNSSGNETSWASPNGQSLLTYTYSSGNLSTMTAIDGTTTTFNYSSGQVSTIVTGNSRTTTLAYSGSNLTQVTNPDGGVQTFSYDGNHHVTGQTFANLQDEWSYSNGALATMTWGSSGSPSMTGYVPAVVQGLTAAVRSATAQQTDATGDVTQWQLDAQGRPLQETAANGGVTTWARDANGYVTATTDPLGRTTSYALDAAGYPTQVTNPDGITESYQYQVNFHALISATDQRGETTTFAYDSEGHLTSTTDALGDITTATYLANGLPQTVTDPRGKTTTFAYDTVRRLTTITDALGDVSTITYDANGFAQTLTDPLGRTTTALNDVMGRVTGTIDPAGDRATVTYNAAGLPLTSTDAIGRQTSTIYDSYNRGLVAEAINAVGTQAQSDTLTSYDADGRVSQTRNADGWVTTYGYDAVGEQTQMTDALGDVGVQVYDLTGEPINGRNPVGNWGSLTYNAVGEVTRSTDALGGVTSFGYDAAGNQTSTTDPLGHTTTALYDALGRTTTSLDGLGNRTTTTYDADGNVSTVTDALSRVTSYAYDALDRVTAVTVAVGTAAQATAKAAYDAAGQLTSTTDALGDVTTYAYNAAGEETAITDPLNHTTTMLYDAAGQLTKTIDAAGDVTTIAYDAAGRQTAVTDPNGHTTTTLYDAAGQMVEAIDPLNDVTRSAYNALGQLVASADANGAVTRYGYDAAGKPVSLTDPDGNTTQWVYDADGRQVNEIDPFNKVVTTAYDAASRVTSVTDQLGRVITYAYDAANRETGSTWKTAGGSTTNVQTFTYDAVGNQLTAADSSGTYTNAYDAQDRMTAQTDPFGVTLTYMYDANSNQTTVQDSLGGTTTSVYDAAGRLTTREFGGSGQTPLRIDLNYDSADRLTGLTRYSDLAGSTLVGTTSYGYDAASRMTSIVSKNASLATVSYYNYQYDNADRVTLESGTGATGTYTYDADGQVLSDGTTTYSYDSNGNRTMSGYAVGTNNQVTTDGTWTYTYDAAGNMVEKSKGASLETWYYSYDNENHLTVVRQTTNGSTNELLVTYTYDVYGQRIEEQKWQSSPGTTVTTEFVWSDGQVVMDLNGSNVVQERYLWGDSQDQLFARIDGNGTAHWYLTDELGSVRDVISASGSLEDHTDYTAYGVIITQSNASAQGRYGFQGVDTDPQTGLQYHRRRYDNPATGTWTILDPSGFDGGDTNLYRDVRNSPINLTDPMGLSGDSGWSLVNRAADYAAQGLDNLTFGLSTKVLTDHDVGTVLDATDGFFAGWSHSLTGGLSSKARTAIYGDTATRNQSGGWFTFGQIVGIVHDVAMIYTGGAQAISGIRSLVSGGGAVVLAEGGILSLANASTVVAVGEGLIGVGGGGLALMVSSGDLGGGGGQGSAPNNGGNAPANFNEQIEQAVQNEWAARGDMTADAMSLESIEGPHQVANLDPALGPNQVRYQTTFLNEANGERINVSVNFDPTTGQFGTIKPSSIQP